MATLYITEFDTVALTKHGAHLPAGQMPPRAQQTVQVVPSAQQSNPFDPKTKFIRVHTDVPAHIQIGESPSATSNDLRLGQDHTEYFGVELDAGHSLSVIQST